MAPPAAPPSWLRSKGRGEMSIFLTEKSKVIVQGMTGSEGRKHTQRMLRSGTQIVGGVNPKKAGTTVEFEGGTEVPVFGSVAEAIKERIGKAAYDIALKNGAIELVPFEVMRGRSWKNAFVLLDEAQNATPSEIKTFLTRIGEDCTMVINGDISQCDLDRDSGLYAACLVEPEAGLEGDRLGAWRVGPLIGLVSGLGWTALGLVLLIGLATAAAVVLATRAAFSANRETIRILHGIGATDEQVTGLFQRRIAIDSLVGGAAGTLAAIALLVVLSAGGLGGLEELAGGALLSLSDVALLLLDRGASPTLVSPLEGMTPLEAARAAGLTEVVDRLS